MAIFDRAPVPVTVWPVVLVDDGYGGTRPGEGEPIHVRVWAEPLVSDPEAQGWKQRERYKLLARSLPGGAWSRIEMLGRDWVVSRPPRTRSYNRRMHFDVAEVIERGDSKAQPGAEAGESARGQ